MKMISACPLKRGVESLQSFKQIPRLPLIHVLPGSRTRAWRWIRAPLWWKRLSSSCRSQHPAHLDKCRCRTACSSYFRAYLGTRQAHRARRTLRRPKADCVRWGTKHRRTYSPASPEVALSNVQTHRPCSQCRGRSGPADSCRSGGHRDQSRGHTASCPEARVSRSLCCFEANRMRRHLLTSRRAPDVGEAHEACSSTCPCW